MLAPSLVEFFHWKKNRRVDECYISILQIYFDVYNIRSRSMKARVECALQQLAHCCSMMRSTVSGLNKNKLDALASL